MELEEIHNCEKCRNKIVLIELDNCGVTHCGYCHQVVDYSPYYQNLDKSEMLNLIEKLKIEKEILKWNNKKKKRKK